MTQRSKQEPAHGQRKRGEPGRSEDLATLYEASREIARQLDLEGVCAAAHRGAQRLMPADVFVISLLDEEKDEVEDIYLFDRSGRAPNRRTAFREGEGIGATVIATGKAVWLDDWSEATAKSLGAKTFGDGIDTRSHLTVPLFVGEKIVGAMGVQDYRPNIYTHEHEQLLGTLAHMVAIALQNARLFESLRANEELTREFAASIPQVFWIREPQRRKMIYVSPAYEKIFGRSLQSLYDDPRSFLEVVHPEDRERVAKADFSEGADSYTVTYRILGPGGETRWVEAQASAIRDGTGTIVRVAGIVEDVTERLTAESAARRLAAIVTASRDAIIGKTLSGIVVDWNAGAERLYGYSAAEMVGRPISILVPPDRPDEMKQLLEKIGRGESVKAYETERITKDGQSVPVSISVSPIRDQAGKIVGASTIGRDMRERKALEKRRDDLLNMIVHDLRNPLTGILLAVESLQGDTLNPQQNKLLEIADNRTRLMLGLVNTLLDVGKLEAGKMPVDAQPTRLADLAAQHLKLQAHMAEARQIELVEQMAADLPEVEADRELIGRVLQNLLDNAIKFTPQGGRITVAAAVDAQNAEKVIVRVTDSGPGIPEELRARLFQPYVTGKMPGRGSGLGLVFCRLAVEAHGGRFWVEGGADQGATFAFELPRALRLEKR